MSGEESFTTGLGVRRHEEIHEALAVNKHYWAIFGTYAITDPERVMTEGEMELDQENLISLQGPMCVFCGTTYTDDHKESACPGIR